MRSQSSDRVFQQEGQAIAGKAVPSLQERAQSALTARLAEIIAAPTEDLGRPGFDPRGYLVDAVTGEVPYAATDIRRLARFGTVGTVSGPELTRGLAQVAGGTSNELAASAAKRPKFLTAYSASALTVNVFAPFLDGRALVLEGQALQKAKLGSTLHTGGKCGRPNFDLLSRNDNAVVAVDVNCTEQLKAKTRTGATDFATLRQRPEGDPYAVRTRTLAGGPGAIELYEVLAADPCAFRYVDATKLLKQYLSLRNTHGTNACTLVYLCWQPENAADFDICAAHAKEAERVAGYLTDRAVTFRSVSTTALWEAWLADENPFLVRHAAALQRRYAVSV